MQGEEKDPPIKGFYAKDLDDTFISAKDLRAFVVEVMMNNAREDEVKLACANDFIEIIDFSDNWFKSQIKECHHHSS